MRCLFIYCYNDCSPRLSTQKLHKLSTCAKYRSHISCSKCDALSLRDSTWLYVALSVMLYRRPHICGMIQSPLRRVAFKGAIYKWNEQSPCTCKLMYPVFPRAPFDVPSKLLISSLLDCFVCTRSLRVSIEGSTSSGHEISLLDTRGAKLYRRRHETLCNLSSNNTRAECLKPQLICAESSHTHTHNARAPTSGGNLSLPVR